MCAFLAVLPLSVAAEEARSPYLERWIPSLALTGGITVQEQESALSSSCANGGREKNDTDLPSHEFRSCLFLEAGPPNSPLIESDDDTDWAVSPTVGANLQLMTPGFEAIPGAPRLFVGGEIMLTFPSTRDIAKVRDPGTLQVLNSFQEAVGIDSRSMTGQGAKTSSEIQTLGFGANAGIAFPFQWLGRRFWLKPFAGWLSYEVEVEGSVVVALKDDRENNTSNPVQQLVPGGPFVSPTGFGSQLIEPALSGSDSKWFHGIGPGFELEMEAARLGSFGVSIFAGGAAYKILGDREIKIAAVDNTSNAAGLPAVAFTLRGQPGRPFSGSTPRAFGSDTYNANWSFEVDPWEYRAILGVRFHWLGGD